MTEIEFWSAVPVDWNALTIEAISRGKQLDLMSNVGLLNKFKIVPDLTIVEKNKIKKILEKSFVDVVIT